MRSPRLEDFVRPMSSKELSRKARKVVVQDAIIRHRAEARRLCSNELDFEATGRGLEYISSCNPNLRVEFSAW